MQNEQAMKINLEREFIIRFTANKRHELGRYFRKVVKSESLPFYIGDENTLTAITKALESVDDKFTIKFRKHGRVEFWRK